MAGIFANYSRVVLPLSRTSGILAGIPWILLADLFLRLYQQSSSNKGKKARTLSSPLRANRRTNYPTLPPSQINRRTFQFNVNLCRTGIPRWT